MMQLSDIRAGYAGREVLHGVSLAFRAGQVTALVGPNGSGKSTLLRCCARLLPYEGALLAAGRDARGCSPKEYARLAAYLPQSRPVPGLLAKTMVLHGRFAYLSYPRRYAPADRAAVAAALEKTGAAALADKSMASLSGGERQRVYIAMALAQDTPILLLDEPTANLDIANQLQLMRLARQLAAEGKTVVMVLHELNLALRFADRVALLENGAVRAEGAPDGIAGCGALEQVFGVCAQPVRDQNGETQYLFSQMERRGQEGGIRTDEGKE